MCTCDRKHVCLTHQRQHEAAQRRFRELLFEAERIAFMDSEGDT